ncbi:hypothetical protein BSKO_07991 [Bryopsis sp. KO-2023]|nr:hypothetical protein BSKO_07991 [Bryopsis sp. KO-2023]
MSLLLPTLRSLNCGVAYRGVSELGFWASGKRLCTTDVASSEAAPDPSPAPRKKKAPPKKPPPPPLSSDEYNEKKAEFGRSMKELRRGLYKDLEKRRTKVKEVEGQRIAAVQKGREIKAARKKAEKTRGADEHAKELKELQEQCAISRAASAKRQAIRESLLEQARNERREYLLLESKTWITREKLDQRIDYAFTMPDMSLYPTTG